ncbi:MAG TPA: cytochrome c oxidase subunit 3 [Caulobacteraceae bacterium]|jgi:cytochrome c oxidase subunit 3
MADYVTLADPFEDPRQQSQANFLGMYVFLGTETMLFGALLALVFTYRLSHPQAAYEAARHLLMWVAAANTAVLLTSSLFVAIAVVAARHGRRRAVVGWLVAALALGVVFLALKGFEYAVDFHEGLAPMIGPPALLRFSASALFIDLYFVATGLHAIHLTVGLFVLGWAAASVRRGRVALPRQAVVLEMTGLYWHFVDVVWVFVFPIFYLARG